ncbi:hypothetical protein OHC33_002404 [Knufia fluminis]|uniref:laccase n=1 Tax=Knufia fluminis TaxID=191047 RepID=A0AAN8IBD6_9EURO|nr:hypothetical protein OHC33_002404 [Knufia fluminis]
MKITTSAALAVAASGVSAQDSWAGWSSSNSGSSSSTSSKPVSSTSSTTKSCPATFTSVETTTKTCYESTSEIYQATVTVPISSKAADVSVEPQWVDWDTVNTTGAPVTSMPAGCTAGKTVTSTNTITSTILGTTTITKSVLYVGASATGNADAAWNAWNTAQGASGSSSTAASVTGSGSSWDSGDKQGSDSGSISGSGSGSGSGFGSASGSNSNDNGNNNSGNGWGNGGSPNSGSSSSNSNNGNTNSGSIASSDSANDGSNNNKGSWGQGSWGGKGNGGQQLGSGNDVFQWTPEAPTNTQSGIAPEYTKNPDGFYSGTPWGGAGDWNDWKGPNGGSGDGGNNNGGGKQNGTVPDNGGKQNGTVPDNGGKNQTTPVNGTSPDYGSKASNVTKPFEFLKDSACNSASDRSRWCGGADIETDYYLDYFGDGTAVGGKLGGHAGFGLGGSCNYDLVITNGTWNSDGTDVQTLLINGQYPGPAIECTWGDLVTINVHNQMQTNGTAVHWHGIRQVGTNDQDGVPGVTECALAPGQSRTYQWRASSYGTSWYHSHWNLQYGDGVQGPIIIHGPATANYDVDAGPVMIADTFGMSATAFGSLIAHVGPAPVDNYLLNGHNVRPDLSSGQHSLWKVQKGKKYLFRIINSAAQNMYSVSIDQHKMKVIAADFVPIEPYMTEWVNIGIGQRYDVVVEMDQDVDSYFFRAVTQTLCPSGSKNSGLGQANGIIAYEGVHEHPIYLPSSTANGNKTAAAFATCNDEPLASLVPHLKKDAGTKSSFQASASTIPGGTVTKVGTSDDGAVFRWFLNNGAMYINYTQPTIQSLSDGYGLNESVYANQITLNQKDQWVYFVIQNQFFAFHPMHLHGHDFSLLGQGDGLFTADMVSTLNFDNPMRRDTAMLRGAASPAAASGGYTVIGFETDNPGAWLMHCHIAWHVDGGLALQWLERPDDMQVSTYTDKQSFKDECSAYSSYEATTPSGKKFSGQSGLKRRENNYFDRMVSEANRQFDNVVRRDGHAHSHYLDGHLKRGLGDGHNRRTFGRRR